MYGKDMLNPQRKEKIQPEISVTLDQTDWKSTSVVFTPNKIKVIQ